MPSSCEDCYRSWPLPPNRDAGKIACMGLSSHAESAGMQRHAFCCKVRQASMMQLGAADCKQKPCETLHVKRDPPDHKKLKCNMHITST